MTERRLLSTPENVDLLLIPLTEYGLRHGLLTEDDLRRLRAESLPLLRCQAERLTDGRSSSLPAETAEAPLDSVFYTVSLALKRCASAATAGHAVRCRAEAADAQGAGRTPDAR